MPPLVAFLTYLRERVGQTFTPEALTQDVRELWNSGFFDDIEVDLEDKEAVTALVEGMVDKKFIGNVIYDNSALGNPPLAAAYSMLPIAIMTVYLLVARRLGAFSSL